MDPKKSRRSASTIHSDPPWISFHTLRSASFVDRPRRYPKLASSNSGSKIGSNRLSSAADTRDHRSRVCRAFDTRRVCPSSEWGVGAPAEVDSYPLSALAAAAPTAGSAAPQKPPESAHQLLHFPGSLSPSPRPSPGSSACTRCRLMNGPSWHPSGCSSPPVSSDENVRVFHSWNCSSFSPLLIWFSLSS